MIVRLLQLGGIVLLIGLSTAFYLFGRTFAVVENTTDSPVSVTFESEDGDSYPVGPVQPSKSARVAISRGDTAIWAVARFPDGREVQSKAIYSTSGINISASVRSDHVDIGIQRTVADLSANKPVQPTRACGPRG